MKPVCCIMALALSFPALHAQVPTVGIDDIATVQQQFATPPDDARIMMRWWWFGPAVVKPELEREILAMKQGGIGGFEIQPVYPMALDDTATNFKNLPYLSPGFLDAVTFANDTAHANGMRIDMTLASGWPYGGPHVPVDEAASRLRVVPVDVPANTPSIPMPVIGNGEKLLATFMGAGTAKQYDPTKLQSFDVEQSQGRAQVTSKPEPYVVIFFIASRTGQQVKRPAVDAEGFVLDHLNATAVTNHLKIVGEPLMKAFGDKPPYAVFSDSLEVFNADWTDDFLQEFQRRRGYDLKPYLPQLTTGTDEQAAELRHDWGLTITELMDERYLSPINDWALAHHTLFRSQTYGFPSVSLSSNRFVSLPEGEGFQWNDFSYTRLATSASHLYGRPVTSSETWTWLDSPAFRANPLDMKAEADRFFLLGVNQLIGHGWPYTPPGVPEPGWGFYAAAVFNDHNPWWIVMPDVTKYLQRVSYLLRQGKPANDVAVLLPNEDAFTDFRPGKVSLSDSLPKYVTQPLMQQILGAGHNLDYIDPEAIEKLGIPYPVLVMPHVERLSPATLKAVIIYMAKGGKVIAVGSTPSLAPGFVNAASISVEVKALSQMLLADKQHFQLVATDADLGTALARFIEPDMKLADVTGNAVAVGFIHRKLSNADIYFVANTGNAPIKANATFLSARKSVSAWDAMTGKAYAVSGNSVPLDLAPYESRVIVFSDSFIASPSPVQGNSTKLLADLSHDWQLSFPGDHATPGMHLKDLTSWADDPKSRYFSGVARYTKTIKLTDKDLTGARSIMLDFGEGTPVTVAPKVQAGMRAMLDAPIREAATVTVNGKLIGSLWHPPYTLDITSALHAGDNTIDVHVANTAINLLAGQAPKDYRLLNARYGNRFSPWDADNLQPLPSGMLGPIHLLETR